MSTASKRKKLPWSRRVPEGASYDAIVIGSGMGGMTTAALLAKLGKKVLVLEQHYVPGGFTHTFKRKGYLWDVGVHVVGEVTTRSQPGRILHAITDGRLEWASLGDVYDEFYFPDDMQINFPNDRDAFRTNLVAAFPDEEEAIDAYLQLIRLTCREMQSYYMKQALPRKLDFVSGFLPGKKVDIDFSRTTHDVITDLTDNPKLQMVFAAQWGYYGSIPSRSSWGSGSPRS